MISARSMWSFLLLGVYSLILLHDFIPHSHQDVQTGKKVHAAIHYIQHAFSDTSSDPLLQLEIANDVGESASSSVEGGHHHELSYRVENVKKWCFQTNRCALAVGLSLLSFNKLPAPKGVYNTGFRPEGIGCSLVTHLRGPPDEA
ncbi:MAG TPA: hypothetical protein VJ917_01885 [Saprospiraceae bacterium]|nr:hypothetical protein [Saprospiraceae bacterium]